MPPSTPRRALSCAKPDPLPAPGFTPGQPHVDIVAGGVGIRADDIRAFDQRLRQFAVHARQADAQVHFNAKPLGMAPMPTSPLTLTSAGSGRLVAGGDKLMAQKQAL